MVEEQHAFSEELIYDPLRTKESFQLIVKLCQDPSVLGKILMDKFTRETSELSTKSSDKSMFCFVVSFPDYMINTMLIFYFHFLM